MYAIDCPQKSHQEFRRSVQLAALEKLLSDEEIEMVCAQLGHRWRDRLLPPTATVRSMVYRSLHPDRSIAAVLADLAAIGGVPGAAPTDSAWCQARSRLPLSVLVELRQRSARRLLRQAGKGHQWFG